MEGELLMVESSDELDFYLETNSHEQSKRTLRWLLVYLIFCGILILYSVGILICEILQSNFNDSIYIAGDIIVLIIILFSINILRRNHNYTWIHQEGKDKILLRFVSVILFDHKIYDKIDMTVLGKKVEMKHKGKQNIFGKEMEQYRCINFQKTVKLGQEFEVRYNRSHRFNLPTRDTFIQKKITPIRLVFVNNSNNDNNNS